ncbi:MAG TPA: hypothetical protein VFN19_06655, partial [Candidatus Nanopelagicales bacterium]|nr:hypothetical protein [Candidatus Nanopelagicales bacterium]
ALPTGRQGRVGRLTVYLSPRLKESGRLRDYPEWVDWPATLTGRLALEVRVDGAVVPRRVVSPPPSSAAWTAVLGPRAPVAAHRFVDFSATPLQPMASGPLSTAILDLYASVSREHPESPPTGADLAALVASSGRGGGGGPTPKPGTLREAADYRAPMADPAETEPEAPDFDFHASISLLGHHPELLRHLGLAVDLEIDLPPGPPGRVGVTTGYGGAGGQAVEAELVTATTPDFLARPNPDPTLTEQAAGFLTLAADKAFLSSLDPHLAATRLAQAARQAGQHGEGSLPALGTRALSLIRPDLTAAFANRTKRQAELEKQVKANLNTGGAPVLLFAEDVAIGQRIDVLDLTGETTWLSLFERQSDTGYTFPRDSALGIVPKPDEGWNTTLLVTEQDDVRPAPNPDRDDPIAPTALFRLDDAVYRWNGWSGAAPPPGAVLDSATGQPAAETANLPADGQTAQVAVDYRVTPASLPRLRFGRTYQMRARCVDLAGNSRDLAAVQPAGAETPPETFGRLEPIAAPIVVRRSPRPVPGIGDTPQEVVLLGDYDTDDDAVEAVDRLIFPGRVGQDLCELHGVPAGGVDPASYAVLATRDALDLADQTLTDPVTGEVVAGTQKPGGPILPGPTRQDVAYLSDPAIGGLSFRFPGVESASVESASVEESGSQVTVPSSGAWPERRAARMVVAAGEGPAVVAPDPETDLAVFVPKAGIVPVQASFGIDQAYLDHFTLWQRLPAADQAALADLVTGGGHWMLTPPRQLTLIHAVRRPLLAPAVIDLTAGRDLGSAVVRLDGELAASTSSTERVSLTGTWTDTVDDPDHDDPAKPGPRPRTTRMALGRIDVPRGTTDTVEVAGLETRLPDTKRHLATVDLEAYSSFAAYFTEERSVVLSGRPAVLDSAGVVAASVEVRLPDGSRARIGKDVVVDGTAGTLALVKGGVVRSGTRVSVRYLARPISRTSDEPDSPAAFTVVLPNTVAPPPPVIDEIVPASARGADGSHSGQVLRVYLRRPWLVTGDGERLSVVLAGSGGAEPAGASVVGRDPVLPSAVPSGAEPLGTLTPADFPRAVAISDGPGGELLVDHQVTFDPISDRWYADVELADRFGYRPFLTLALARHQPESVDDAAVSPRVTTEPVRLGLVRQTTVAPSGAVAEVSVAGTDGLGNRVQATIQQADPAIKDKDLRWRSVGATVDLASTVSDGVTTWAGSLDLTGTSGALRVLVEELEPGRRDENGAVAEAWTVVFVETVELPTQ